MNVILAADTATTINTVALCTETAILAETTVDCHRLHSERLLSTVDWVLGEAGKDLGHVTALAISNGPGSFTGLRIGAATWKGLALANDLPLVAVPTLDAMTRPGAWHQGLVCPMIDARMKEVFGAWYRFENGARTKLTEDRVCPVEDLLEDRPGDPDEPCFLLGDGAAVYRDRIAAHSPGVLFAPVPGNVPRASAVAAEAFALLAAGTPTDARLVAPVYLRKSQAEVNRERRCKT